MAVAGSERVDVCLVTMPWAPVSGPSVQLGTVGAALERAGISWRAAHFNLEFYSSAVAHSRPDLSQLSLSEFTSVSRSSLLNEWIFFVPPLVEDGSSRCSRLFDAAIAEQSSHPPRGPVFTPEQATHLRSLVPRFLDRCLDELMACSPKVVAFSCSFNQLLASLALAKMLKERHEETTIVFGGTRFDAEMGPAVLRAYPWIDAIVRGDGEAAVGPLFSRIVAGSSPEPFPGLCLRKPDGEVAICDGAGSRAYDVSRLDVPLFDEYFERLSRHGIFEPESVWVESTRGCWWGETKSKCRFCGRRREDLTFRRKEAKQVENEIRVLAQRHRATRFSFADPCVDPELLWQALLPLRREGYTFSFWVEGRVMNSRRELERLAAVGVQTIFAGIEQLSTSILRQMSKGFTGLQAIRFLKWAAELNVRVTWNLLFGFPHEDPTEYDRLASVVPHLRHLAAPFGMSPIAADRFSSLWTDPTEYGLEILPYSEAVRAIYGVTQKDLLDDLPGTAAHRLIDQPDPATYIGRCQAKIDDWRANQSSYRQLVLQRGPGFVRIVDGRDPACRKRHLLEDLQADVYMACCNGATIGTLASICEGDHPDELEEFLASLEQEGLVYREGERILSLALDSGGSKSQSAEDLESV